MTETEQSDRDDEFDPFTEREYGIWRKALLDGARAGKRDGAKEERDRVRRILKRHGHSVFGLVCLTRAGWEALLFGGEAE